MAALLVHGRGTEAGLLVNIPHPKCEIPNITVWAGFRSHVLVPHDVVGTIIDDRPTFAGLTKQGNTYYRAGRPILRVVRHTHPNMARVVVTALEDVWLQEPGLVVKIAGGGTWQGYGPDYSSASYALTQKDAHRSTVHFSRASGQKYVQTIRYRDGDKCLTLYSDGGFASLLASRGPPVPWQGAEVFSEGYRLAGVLEGPNEQLRRWELAGKPPDIGQMYFLGWTGGAAAVVDADGQDNGAPADRYLWQPRSWRLLRRGHEISESLYVTAS